ncbi:hypothetical protein [Brevibacterium moorei]|uniref:hypothetical protein n=1 Tax=Brevibacterium moorei TaxID=2968457 RepID=UPI00211C48D8|nr:hypothetical protein [Brevibacterium sp. 68QC2CO]MCQ9384397.1 hypothetical protein [Brevibacterium sp. 68QC2CO]
MTNTTTPRVDLAELCLAANQASREKGFWDRDREGAQTQQEQHNEVGMKLALVHSELSEALEELRSGNAMDHVYHREDGKPEGFLPEIADVIIRLADLVGKYGLETALAQQIGAKLAYNTSRPPKHGREF